MAAYNTYAIQIFKNHDMAMDMIVGIIIVLMGGVISNRLTTFDFHPSLRLPLTYVDALCKIVFRL